ncbi:sensor histidine kinase [Streptomyces sp. LZ34]
MSETTSRLPVPSLPPPLSRWGPVAGLSLVLYATAASGTGPGAGEGVPGAALAGVTVAMALPLGWARARPWPVLAALLAESAGVVALGARAEQIWPLFLAADLLVGALTATVARRVGPAAAAVTLAVQETALQADLFRDGGWGRVFAPGFLALTTLLAVLVLCAWLAGMSVRQRREYGEELRARTAAEAVTAERLRIARELHDMVAHSIGVIAIQAGAGSRVLDSRPEQARSTLDAIETTSRETLQGLRSMLDVLRRTEPETVESMAATPFAGLADLDRLTATTAHTGVRVEVRWRGERRPLPSAVDQSAFRIVQESVTNVVRHAGTRHCRVSIDYRHDELRVEIVDEGHGGHGGAGASGSGYGITGMRERVALLDGRFSAGPRPEGGFRVAARLPLSAAPALAAPARPAEER